MMRLAQSTAFSVGVLVVGLIVIWYAGAIYLNAPFILDLAARDGITLGWPDLVMQTWNQGRPVLPAPHQVAVDLVESTLQLAPWSKRSLLFHAWITLSSALLGFVAGTALGILLAAYIVHSRAAARSLMPWIIASQTIPILALAPVIVILSFNILTGDTMIARWLHLDSDAARLVSKAVISTYLSFFPVAVGMVKGFRSPELIQLDLMRTYNASRWTTFWLLRWPVAIPFLFASMKVAIAASLVGAIVAELPTGAVSGLGSRLLTGSYNGQVVQIWSTLIIAALLAGLLVFAVGLAERMVLRRTGGQPA